MKHKTVVVSKFEFGEDAFVYVDVGVRDRYNLRLDKKEFLDGKLPNIGDEVEVERRGLYWIRAQVTHRLKLNWKTEGF